MEKIRQGSPDISGMKEQIAVFESMIRDKDELIKTLKDQIYTKSGVDPETLEIVEDEQENTKPKAIKKTTKSKASKENNSEKTMKTSTQLSPDKPNPSDYPVMKDILIRDLPKTEREWILIYALYSSDFGESVLTRDDIIAKYEESSRRTDNRMKNLTNNIRNMVKSNQLKFINDDEMLLTTSGRETATEILNR